MALNYDAEADIVTFTTAGTRSLQSLSVSPDMRSGRGGRVALPVERPQDPRTADYVHGR